MTSEKTNMKKSLKIIANAILLIIAGLLLYHSFIEELSVVEKFDRFLYLSVIVLVLYIGEFHLLLKKRRSDKSTWH